MLFVVALHCGGYLWAPIPFARGVATRRHVTSSECATRQEKRHGESRRDNHRSILEAMAGGRRYGVALRDRRRLAADPADGHGAHLARDLAAAGGATGPFRTDNPYPDLL